MTLLWAQKTLFALASVTQVVECHLVLQKVANLISGQGTYPGCECIWFWCIQETISRCFSFTSMFLSPHSFPPPRLAHLSFLSKINKTYFLKSIFFIGLLSYCYNSVNWSSIDATSPFRENLVCFNGLCVPGDH